MKNKLIVAALFACMSLLPYMSFAAEQGNMSAEGKQELEETMQWLKGKIEGMQTNVSFTSMSIDGYSNTYYLKYNKFSYEGCKITISQELVGNNRGEIIYDLSTIFSIGLGNYTAPGQTTNPPVYKVTVTSTEDIVSKYILNGSDKSQSEYLKRRDIVLIDDYALGERLVKAFNYANKLCGGAKEEKF